MLGLAASRLKRSYTVWRAGKTLDAQADRERREGFMAFGDTL